MPAPDSLKQRRKTIPLETGSIVVRRMYHGPTREFIRRFAAAVSTRADLFRGRAASDATWLDVLLPQLPALVQGVDELADFLVANSTDDAAALAKADFDEWAQVLAAALELNCGEDLKNSFAGIAAALAPLLATFQATKTNSGASSTPSSSMPATAPTTSIAAPSSTSTSS